jgi:hypothetical protein
MDILSSRSLIKPAENINIQTNSSSDQISKLRIDKSDKNIEDLEKTDQIKSI